MANQPNSRGRPKGTGIDDGEKLAAILNLMSSNPDMRPTTAIKALGIDDPSVIRRLRDKLKAPQISSGDPSAASPQNRGHVRRDGRQTEAGNSATISLSGPRDAVRKSRRRSTRPDGRGASTLSSPQSSGAHNSPSVDEFNPVSIAFATSAYALNFVASQQAAALREWNQTSFVKSWFHLQIQCAEAFLNFSRDARAAWRVASEPDRQ